MSGSGGARGAAAEAAAGADGDCRIRVGDLACARLVLHCLRPADTAAHIEVSGRTELAAPRLAARAVMGRLATTSPEEGS